MKFAYTADLHLSGYTNDKIVNQLPERLNSIKNVLYEIAKYCIENEIPTIVIGGDILHGKSIIHALAQSIMLDYFRDFCGKIEFIVLDGNHDFSAKGKDAVSALKSIDNEPNVLRYTKPTMVQDEIFFVPWSYDMIDAIKNNSAKFLISHFGLNEGILNSGMSIIADIGLPQLVGKYKYVLLGHYHKPQSIINKDIALYYVGSPIQIDWGEKNEEKRFLVVDTEKPSIESVPTEGYTKYMEFYLTQENADTLAKEAKALKDEGHLIKLVKTESFDTSKLEDVFTVIDKTEKDITNRGVDSTMSMEDKLKTFLEIKEIPEDQIEEYMTLGLEIIDDSLK